MDGLRAAACAGARDSEQRALEYPGRGHNKIQVNFLQTVPVSACTALYSVQCTVYCTLYTVHWPRHGHYGHIPVSLAGLGHGSPLTTLPHLPCYSPRSVSVHNCNSPSVSPCLTSSVCSAILFHNLRICWIVGHWMPDGVYYSTQQSFA